MQNNLGIIVDKELKFHEQTAAAVKKANQVLGIIKKTIYTKNKITLTVYVIGKTSPGMCKYCVGTSL